MFQEGEDLEIAHGICSGKNQQPTTDEKRRSSGEFTPL